MKSFSIAGLTRMLPQCADILGSLKNVEDGGWKPTDADYWIYQSWADDIVTTPSFNHDYVVALKSIKARTLILAGEGHSAAGGITAPENDDQNRKIADFLNSLPAR